MADVAASLAHELRTPLNGILGYAQLLARDPSLGTRPRAAVENIRLCGERMLGLIGQYLGGDEPGDEPIEPGTRGAQQGESLDTHAARERLSPDMHARLSLHAGRGDVAELNRALDELESVGDPRLVADLRTLARAFDMRAVRERLERLLPEGS